MKKVFVSQNPTEAHLVKALLEGEGIQSEVRGEMLFGTRGGTPATPDTLPSVWILDDSQFARAAEFVSDYERTQKTTADNEPPWRCQCGEMNEPQFSECWNCGGFRLNVQ
jgi:hypothetical protein